MYRMSVRCCVLGMLAVSAVGAIDSPAFGFSPVLGDYMVLQQSPSRAAVYGLICDYLEIIYLLCPGESLDYVYP